MPTTHAAGAGNENHLAGIQEFRMNATLLRTVLTVTAIGSMASFAAAQGQYGYAGPGQQAAYMPEMYEGGMYEGGEYGGPVMYDGGYYDGGCGQGCGEYGGCQCGGAPYGCEPPCPSCDCGPKATMCYAEIQNTFLRAHVTEEAVGKLSEKHEWAPRAIVGFELPSGIGARGRYFNYSHETTILDNGGEELGLEFEVIDVESTARFRTTHADLILSGGFRWADILIEEDDDAIRSDMPGLTVAGDLRGVFCRGCRSEWAGVGGARWSLLGGDWEGNDNDLVEETRDDNMVVQELYGGVEWVCFAGHCNFYARAVFEMQTWRSDALDENDASISFVGPALHGGVTF
jgi:hypothetical protein